MGLLDKLFGGRIEKNHIRNINELEAFLKKEITAKMPLDSIIQVFEKMCRMPVENDMILFETGTYDFTGEPMFCFSLVRQFLNEEEEYVQIHVDVLYIPTRENTNLQTSVWNEELEEDIFTYIRGSEAYLAVKEDEYIKVNVYVDET